MSCQAFAPTFDNYGDRIQCHVKRSHLNLTIMAIASSVMSSDRT
ncbi:hypothetical protein [Nostoc sp. KVJ3]|nr:hypothetical protein [Nostoc sp. KVJ3]